MRILAITLNGSPDQEYTTLHARGFTDMSGGAPFVVHNLGVPRTFHMSYGFSF
jgi:hypothetical protein